MDEVARADEIFVMNEGRIVLKEKPAKVFLKVEWLKELGLAVPKVTELMWQLRQVGKSVRTNIFTLEDACIELGDLLRD
jgi:hypothetical protein